MLGGIRHFIVCVGNSCIFHVAHSDNVELECVPEISNIIDVI